MNGKKNMTRSVVILAIVLILYCVLAFAIPFVRGGVFWLSFVFSLIAICAQFYVLKTSFDHGESARSKFYGFPIARIGIVYLVVQLIAGFVCMALGAVLPAWAALVVFVIILAAAASGLITTEGIRDEVERQDEVLKTNVMPMRTLQSKAAAIASQCEDASLKNILTALSDKFRFSDPVSSAATEEAETGLAALMEELQAAVLDNDSEAAAALAKRLEAALSERNRLCMLGK
jgi:hypothetical protein